jgi:D-alanine-D-alanine ligase-like ATP-grasp enzyme
VPVHTPTPDADRPIGAFITEHVQPTWGQLNEYPRLNRHIQAMNYGLRQRRMPVHQFQGWYAAFLYNGDIVGGRYGRMTTLVSDQAAEACASKTLTQSYAAGAGLPVAGGQAFSTNAEAEARQHLAADGLWVVKPDGARRGRGVSLQVTEGEFSDAWQRAVRSRPREARSPQKVVVEPFHDGLLVRFFVVGGTSYAASARVPLFVIGDGSSTVAELVRASFEHRSAHALLKSTLPSVATVLSALPEPLTGETVLEPGELRILQEDGRLTAGGLPFDVTDMISPALRSLAERAAQSIPGLGAAGIDLITPQLDSADGAVIVDADAWASVLIHRFPAFGRRRRVMWELTQALSLRAQYWENPSLPPTSHAVDDAS